MKNNDIPISQTFQKCTEMDNTVLSVSTTGTDKYYQGNMGLLNKVSLN